MKINFSDYDLSDFSVKEGLFCGIPAKLITPKDITTKFSQKTKIFRSSIWSLDGELLSGGLPKFKNYGEDPIGFPFYDDGGHDFIEKIDGSLVILDYVNSEISMRTRGVFNYKTAENYKDFEYCLTDRIKDFLHRNPQSSLLCELTSRNQQIVLDYGELPKFWVVGLINKGDYSLFDQDCLDLVARSLELNRPKRYSFNSVEDAIKNIKDWKNLEGCVCYNKTYDAIHKIKSDEYLARHRFKSNATLPNTVDLFFSFNCPPEQEFKNKLIANFDFECFQMVEQFVPTIINTYNKLLAGIHDINNFILPYYLVETPRKIVAQAVLAKYRENGLSSFVFQIFDKKTLDLDSKRKMFNVLLEKNEKL